MMVIQDNVGHYTTHNNYTPPCFLFVESLAIHQLYNFVVDIFLDIFFFFFCSDWIASPGCSGKKVTFTRNLWEHIENRL
jgi:hypothetical protein